MSLIERVRRNYIFEKRNFELLMDSIESGQHLLSWDRYTMF
jgi:hypothetical protein